MLRSCSTDFRSNRRRLAALAAFGVMLAACASPTVSGSANGPDSGEMDAGMDGGIPQKPAANSDQDPHDIVIPDEYLHHDGVVVELGAPVFAEPGVPTLSAPADAKRPFFATLPIAGPYKFEVTTCSNVAAPGSNDAKDDILILTIQSNGKAIAYSLDDTDPKKDDRAKGNTDTYTLTWPASIGGVGSLESLKFDHWGNPWCVNRIALKYKAANGDESLLWKWDSSQTQANGTYLQGHDLSGAVTLPNAQGTHSLRFTNKTVKFAKGATCASNRRSFGMQTGFTASSPTNDKVTLEIRHDKGVSGTDDLGLIDFIELPKSSMDTPKEEVDTDDNTWCGLRSLDQLVLTASGTSDWNACNIAYLSDALIPLNTLWQNHHLWDDTSGVKSNDGNLNDYYCHLVKGGGSTVVAVNKIVDDCSSCVLGAHQGFALTPTSCAQHPDLQDRTCDGVDDDCDGVVDDDWTTKDSACIGECATNAKCSNGSVTCGKPAPEVNGNGKDEDCSGTADDAKTEVSCTDGKDNEGDGKIDCQDSDCSADNACRADETQPCAVDGDCDRSLICLGGTCRKPSCSNGVKDTNELGIDCGGPCPACTGCESSCRPGEPTTPASLATLRFSDASFQRATSAMYESKPGVLATARPNELRWVNVQGRRMALIEGASDNVVKWSAALNHTPEWTASNLSPVTVAPDGAPAPDGSTTAEVFTSAAPGQSPFQSISLNPGAWTLSLYLRAEGSGSYETRPFVTTSSPSAVLAGGSWPALTSWSRFDLPVTVAATSSASVRLSQIANWPTDGVDAITLPPVSAWGAQLEARPFPTSYVPTAAATATRAGDELKFAFETFPSWMSNKTWQVDVQPLYSSAEIDSKTYTLLSSGDLHTSVSLIKSPNAGAARLRITLPSSTFTSPDFTWYRGDVLSLTFDMTAKTVTVDGADDGGGNYAVPNLAFSPAPLAIGFDLRRSAESAFAAFGEPRQISGLTEVCKPSSTCLCRNGKLDSDKGEVCDPTVSAHCNSDCTAATEVPCSSDQDCAAGSVCGSDNGVALGRGHGNYCWPTGCPAGCGQVDSACGTCVCQPDCSQAVCGGNDKDKCGHYCPSICGDGVPGPKASEECMPGSIFAAGQGAAFGLPDGTGVCWPKICDDPRQRLLNCGPTGALCGTCPAMPNECGTRVCGTDRYNHSCGQCGAGLVCEDDGQCRVRPVRDVPPQIKSTLNDPQANEAGGLPGSFDVDDSGAATYAIPIEVPPGRGGLTPNLALSYRSTNGDGYVGRGWSVTGLSGVTRCARTFAQDGYARGVQNDAKDAFCLDGKRLVAISGEYGADGTEYRTEIDSFVRVISNGIPTNSHDVYTGPSYFTVLTRDGRTLSFGTTSASRVTAVMAESTSNYPMNVSWLLDTITDLADNSLRVEYERDERMNGAIGAGGSPRYVAEIRPSTIYYGADDSHVVSFKYAKAAYGSAIRSFRASVPRQMSSPLLRIETSIQSGAARVNIRTYKLTQSFEQGAWFLRNVQACAAHSQGEACMPATSFGYGAGSGVSYTTLTTNDTAGKISDNKNESDYPWGYRYYHVYPYDHDGDGNEDILHDQSGLENLDYDTGVLSLRTSRGKMVNGSAFSGAEARIAGDDNCLVPVVLDVNNDGRDDLVTNCHFSLTTVYLSTDDGYKVQPLAELLTDRMSPIPGDTYYSALRWVDGLMALDFDGDGRQDLAGYVAYKGYVSFYRNVGGRFERVALESITPQGSCRAADVDGDGVGEVVCYGVSDQPIGRDVMHYVSVGKIEHVNTWESGTRTDTSVGPGPFISNGIPFDFSTPDHVLDANGDGIQDVIVHKKDQPSELYLGTGKGYLYVSRAPRALREDVSQVAFDIDSDGRDEILEGNRDTHTWEVHRPYTFDSKGAATWIIDASLEPFFAYARRFHKDVLDYAHPVALDWDGDGVKELLVRIRSTDGNARYPRFQLIKPPPRARLMLTSVTDGFGKKITVTYDAKPSDYEPAYLDCDYPLRCLRVLPNPVVVSQKITGSGGRYRDPTKPAESTISRLFEYSYADARVDLRGRGWLGFGKRTVREFVSDTDLLSKTTFVYDLDINSEQHKLYYGAGRPSGIVVETTTDGPSLHSPQQVNHTTSVSQTWSLETSAAGRPFVSLKSRTTTLYESVATTTKAVSSTTSEYLYDTSGNRKYAKTSWMDGRTEEVSSTFYPPDDYLDLNLSSLPKDVSVTSSSADKETKSHSTHYSFYPAHDPSGNQGLVSSIQTKIGTAVERTIAYKYDQGNPTEITTTARRSPTRVDTIKYDTDHFYPIELSNTTYRDHGVSATQVAYDARTGALQWAMAPDGSWSSANYDGFGRLRSTSNDSGLSTSVDYIQGGSGGGKLTVRSQGAGQPTVETEYNAFGQTILQRSAHWGGADGVALKTSVQEFGYDELGRPVSEGVPHLSSDAAPSVFHSYQYDDLGRIVSEGHPWVDATGKNQVATSTHYWDTLAFVADGTWSAVSGGILAHTVEDPSKYRSTAITNDRQELLAAYDAKNTLTKYEYGAGGYLKTATTLGQVTTNSVDDLGRVTGTTDPERGAMIMVYDGMDRLRELHRNPTGKMPLDSYYDYDFLGRRTSATTPDGTYTWHYDGDLADPTLIGKLDSDAVASSTVGNSSSTYLYGGPGGAVTEVRHGLDGESLATRFEYGAFGRPSFVHYPYEALVTKYEYSPQGRVQGVYDTSDLTHPLWRLNDVDAFGHAIKATARNGLVTKRKYESATGRLSDTTVLSGDGSVTYDDDALAYDSRGLVSWQMRNSVPITYDHDELGRLKKQTFPDSIKIDGKSVGTLKFDYDLEGNLTLKPGIGALNYNTKHQVSTTEDGRAFFHDEHGRQYLRTGKGIPDGQQTIAYSAFDLPVSVTSGPTDHPTGVTSYRYNADNARIARNDPNGDRVRYVDDIYEQTTSIDGKVTRALHVPMPDGANVDVLIDSSGTRSVRYQSVDHLGSVATVSDSTGKVQGTGSFDPFGGPGVLGKGSLDTRYGFTGQEGDATGLINMRGRMYDPAVGRFLSPDPIVQAPSFSQSWNRYSYVLNNPINMIDPTGFEGVTDEGEGWEEADGSVTAIEDQPTVWGTRPSEGSNSNPLAADSGERINDGADLEPLPDVPGSAIVDLAIGVDNAVEATKYGIGATGSAGLEIEKSMIPVVGELGDLDILDSTRSTPLEKTLAGISLGANLLTLGFLPNLSGLIKADHLINGATDAAHVTAEVVDDVSDATGRKVRFIADDVGNIVDTQATPPGRWIQPDRSATDILQHAEHPGLDPFTSRTHTHPAVVNVNPNNPAQRSVSLGDPRSVTAEEALNIAEGRATPAGPKGRGR